MMIRNVMALCDKSGQFLFQVMPDRFPHGRVTSLELELWSRYYTEKKAKEKSRRK